MPSPERYVAAVAMLAIVAGSLAVASNALRRRLAPEWSGPPAVLAQIVLALAILVAIGEIAGAVGLLELPVVVLGSLLAAAVVLRGRVRGSWPGRLGAARERWSARAVRITPAGVVVALAVGVLVVQWIALTLAGLDRGMLNQDSVWYHLPLAGRFAQEGTIMDVFFPSADPLSSYPPDPAGLPSPSEGPAFYPATTSLLHAIGILLVGHDTLSPLLNLGWLAVALLAAWCVGRPAGVAPATLAAGALALSLPSLAGSQPGEAINDVAGVALLLAAAALLVAAREGTLEQAPAAAAAGLAVGIKLTFVAPAAALAAGAVWLAGRGARLRSASLWLGALAALGGVWYLRNLIHTGSPLPLVKLGIGDLAFPTVELGGLERFGQSVADYATDFEVWRTAFVPALPEGFGNLWPLVFALTAAGIVLGIASGPSPKVRILALVAAISALAYVLTPQGAGGAQADNPGLFLFNMRFATPAIALGLVVLPLCRPFASAQRSALLAAGLSLAALLTIATAGGWPDNDHYTAAAIGLWLALTAVVLAATRLRAGRHALGVAACGLLVVAGVAGWLVHRNYIDRRYMAEDLDRRELYAWGAGVTDSRIAISGLVALEQYPLFGRDVSNAVQYPGREGKHGALRPIGTCRAWRRALADGGFDYVVISPFDPEGVPVELAWTRPGAREVFRDRDVRVFGLDERGAGDGCSELAEGRGR